MCETVKLNLFDVFTSDSKQRAETIEYTPTELSLTNTTYPVVKKSPVKLLFEAFEIGKVKLSGSFELSLLVPCDRCLEEQEICISCDFDTVLYSPEQASELDEVEEMPFLNQNEFDVYSFVNMNVLMNMPTKVLCSEECKGLCPVCGQNRNLKDCGCDTFVPDPRMASIMDIFMKNKEV